MPIFHSQNFALVDRAGRVRGAYDALTEDGRRALHAMLATVVAEPPPTDVYVPADAADPKWTAARHTAQTAAARSLATPHAFR